MRHDRHKVDTCRHKVDVPHVMRVLLPRIFISVVVPPLCLAGVVVTLKRCSIAGVCGTRHSVKVSYGVRSNSALR